jgi:hypothetical protein
MSDRNQCLTVCAQIWRKSFNVEKMTVNYVARELRVCSRYIHVCGSDDDAHV